MPDPIDFAYGGRPPYSSNRDVAIWVYCTTTVLAPSCPPSVAIAGAPSIQASQRLSFADQRKVQDAAGYFTE